MARQHSSILRFESATQNYEKIRQRSFANKTRSGCDVCKRRHIKCDESKPSCLRCLKAKRQCTYTKVPQQWIFQPGKPTKPDSKTCRIKDAKTTVLEQSRRLNSSIHPTVVPSSPWTTDNDVKYFQYYIERAGPRFAECSPYPSFWLHFIPQLAWQDETVRHTVSALASGFQFFLGDQSKEATARECHTRATDSWSRNGMSALPALVMSSAFAVATMGSGEWENSGLHRAANHKIHKRLLKEANGYRNATMQIVEQTQKLSISYNEFVFDDHDLLHSVSADTTVLDLFNTLRALRQRFEHWLFAIPRTKWLALCPASRWAVLFTRSLLCEAWTLCLFPSDGFSSESSGMQTIRQLQALRLCGLSDLSPTVAELSNKMNTLVSPGDDYEADAILLSARLKDVREAYVNKVLDLLEMHRMNPWVCGDTASVLVAKHPAMSRSHSSCSVATSTTDDLSWEMASFMDTSIPRTLIH